MFAAQTDDRVVGSKADIRNKRVREMKGSWCSRKFAIAAAALWFLSRAHRQRWPRRETSSLIGNGTAWPFRPSPWRTRPARTFWDRVATPLTLPSPWIRWSSGPPQAGERRRGGFAVIHTADGGDYAPDFREMALGAATRDMYRTRTETRSPGERTWLAPGIPERWSA